MRKLSAAVLAVAITAALVGGFVTVPESAEAVTSKTNSAGVEGHKPKLYWSAQYFEPWYGHTSYFGIEQRDWRAGQTYTAPAGSLAFRVEYPGHIESIRVHSGPWRVESQDMISFVLTNAEPVTINFGLNAPDSPLSTIQVDGQFARTFVVCDMVRGPSNVTIKTNAGAELAHWSH